MSHVDVPTAHMIFLSHIRDFIWDTEIFAMNSETGKLENSRFLLKFQLKGTCFN